MIRCAMMSCIVSEAVLWFVCGCHLLEEYAFILVPIYANVCINSYFKNEGKVNLSGCFRIVNGDAKSTLVELIREKEFTYHYDCWFSVCFKKDCYMKVVCLYRALLSVKYCNVSKCWLFGTATFLANRIMTMPAVVVFQSL